MRVRKLKPKTSRRRKRADRRKRIEQIKAELMEMSGGDMLTEDNPKFADSEVVEAFWENVLAIEKAPRSTWFAQLQSAGVTLPPPNALEDAELHDKLWEVIRKLAEWRVFLYHTDHLNDRELYATLWERHLRQETEIMPPDPRSAWHVDIIGGCSEEDLLISRRYYDSEAERDFWREEYPDMLIPPHEDPPYDRDRHLPQAGM